MIELIKSKIKQNNKNQFFYKKEESEELYRNLFEMAPDGIATINLRGVITSCNPSFLKLTGFSKNEIIGKHISRLPTIRKKDIPKYLKIIRFLLKGKTTKPVEFKWIHKNGTTRLADVRVSLIKKDGKTIGLQGIVRDITESRKVDEDIRINEEKFRNIFEKASDCLIYLDKSGKILDVNKKSIEVFGGLKSQLVGNNFTKLGLFHPKDTSKLLIALGYGSLEALSKEKSNDLYQKIKTIDKSKMRIKRLPSVKEIKMWVKSAQKLIKKIDKK